MSRDLPALAIDFHRADTPAQLFRKVEDLADGLALMAAAEDLGSDLARGTSRSDLRERGYVDVADICPRATCEALSTLIDRLLDAGLPATFALASDAALAIGSRVRDVVSTVMSRPYVLVEDAWAWRIQPGASGWPPHRGTTALLDRDAPELVNTWVALSDVEADRACMHFVPLDEDPAYPDQLERIDPIGPSRPAPVSAGSLLFWNANILHWGGSCSPSARGPRRSCSFSLGRADVPHLSAHALSPSLSPLERIDFIASQIAIYGEGQPDVSVEVLDWARATVALRRLGGPSRKER